MGYPEFRPDPVLKPESLRDYPFGAAKRLSRILHANYEVLASMTAL